MNRSGVLPPLQPQALAPLAFAPVMAHNEHLHLPCNGTGGSGVYHTKSPRSGACGFGVICGSHERDAARLAAGVRFAHS